jgi:TonB family protein
MKKSLLLLFATFATLVASAQTKVEIDGIWYNLISKAKQAEVTSSPTKYEGDLVIPAIVAFQEENYEVTTIGDNAFASCGLLGSVIIPRGVVRIGDNAFSSCHSLSSIIIPEGVKSIGSNAFYNCRFIESIVLPNGLETIDFSAFAFCPNLEEVYCYAENIPSAKPNAFDGSNLKHAVLHVPDSSIDSYKTVSPWSKFSNMMTDNEEEERLKTSIGIQGTFDLNGRSISGEGLPRPITTVQAEGRVVVTITVNPTGEVVATSINLRTNTSDPELRKVAEEAAKRARFDKINGVDNQTGTITYYFKTI